MKYAVLTAKHHDGFCLWPSKYTEHSVKNSPFQGDVVKLAAEACARAGIPFGSTSRPGTGTPRSTARRPTTTTSATSSRSCSRAMGEIFCVWFDNACGEGPTGKKQVYDFPRYFDLIRKYQPNAVIFKRLRPGRALVRQRGRRSAPLRVGGRAERAVLLQ